ncbi:hypothetical protein CHS0354_015986 [Potamilus streckersoni]|uniref:RING-CH-type domain-containing protein n=1 Tax=Potamilus streckersoni TaxID=2493646 RepID=A0AAE0SZ97_9BIVA|nr:hypothetical protein CHS0354_015986 [Potamilus streckersoni]
MGDGVMNSDSDSMEEEVTQHLLLAPNHDELVCAATSSVSLPPRSIRLQGAQQELVWAGSSLGTVHKIPMPPINCDIHRDLLLSNSYASKGGINGNNFLRSPGHCGSGNRFGSPTVSDTGTDVMSITSICRICQMPEDNKSPLFTPCRCTGTLRYVHSSCLKKWIHISSRRRTKPPRCELCHFQFNRHKHFKFHHWKWPRVSVRDKCLHIIFFVSLIIMLGCAVATIMCFLYDRGKLSKFPKDNVELSREEIVTLICGVSFFVAFFLAMTVEIKAKHTLYKLVLRFIMHNTEWTIEEYDRNTDPLFKEKGHYV